MKTIVVISDTHGHRAGIEKLKPLFAENDYIIHLGDGASDMRDIVNAYPEKTFVCQGNCDFFFRFARRRTRSGRRKNFFLPRT